MIVQTIGHQGCSSGNGGEGNMTISERIQIAMFVLALINLYVKLRQYREK
jgi:hypothetical protein